MKALMTGVVGLLIGAVGGYFAATSFLPKADVKADQPEKIVAKVDANGNLELNTAESRWAYYSVYDAIQAVNEAGLGDFTEILDVAARDALADRPSQVSREEAIPAFQIVSQKIRIQKQAERDAQIEKNKADGAAFLAEKAKEEGVVTLPSGLLLKPIVEGAGKKPGPTDRVKVLYHGTLIDGTVFDSAKERGVPVEFGLNQVIPGWTEGLQHMSEGSTYMLYVPSDLAYGDAQKGNVITPASTLVFEVQLLEVK